MKLCKKRVCEKKIQFSHTLFYHFLPKAQNLFKIKLIGTHNKLLINGAIIFDIPKISIQTYDKTFVKINPVNP